MRNMKLPKFPAPRLFGHPVLLNNNVIKNDTHVLAVVIVLFAI